VHAIFLTVVQCQCASAWCVSGWPSVKVASLRDIYLSETCLKFGQKPVPPGKKVGGRGSSLSLPSSQKSRAAGTAQHRGRQARGNRDCESVRVFESSTASLLVKPPPPTWLAIPNTLVRRASTRRPAFPETAKRERETAATKEEQQEVSQSQRAGVVHQEPVLAPVFSNLHVSPSVVTRSLPFGPVRASSACSDHTLTDRPSLSSSSSWQHLLHTLLSTTSCTCARTPAPPCHLPLSLAHPVDVTGQQLQQPLRPTINTDQCLHLTPMGEQAS